MNLSKDASEILDILLLTNAHYPEINISKNQLKLFEMFLTSLETFFV